mmetsp:Transcript_8889/g.20968  ORF Transcript_8889/g.20968 Transcript_8889/m.20968 type:complete len:201 (-) Transcript_8889:149-751(-)
MGCNHAEALVRQPVLVGVEQLCGHHGRQGPQLQKGGLRHHHLDLGHPPRHVRLPPSHRRAGPVHLRHRRGGSPAVRRDGYPRRASAPQAWGRDGGGGDALRRGRSLPGRKRCHLPHLGRLCSCLHHGVLLRRRRPQRLRLQWRSVREHPLQLGRQENLPVVGLRREQAPRPVLRRGEAGRVRQRHRLLRLVLVLRRVVVR